MSLVVEIAQNQDLEQAINEEQENLILYVQHDSRGYKFKIVRN